MCISGASPIQVGFLSLLTVSFSNLINLLMDNYQVKFTYLFRWMSPESLTDLHFSTQSDSWSFG